MTALSLEEQATNYDTMRHIHRVSELIHLGIRNLLDRADKHDKTKLESPEVELFTEYTDKLKHTTYGSQEYNDFKAKLGPALAHHYANNPHHPEHYKSGIDDMSLFDILEMLMDWKASSERHHDGNIRKSIEINGTRFGISPQLIKILENTVDELC